MCLQWRFLESCLRKIGSLDPRVQSMKHSEANRKQDSQKSIPAPPGRLPLGYANELQSDVLGLSSRLGREYGGIVRVPIPAKRLYIVSDADLVHDILVQTEQTFLKGSQNARFEPLLGRGLVLSNGTHWKRQRRLMNPFFSPAAIRSFESHIQSAIEEIILPWKDLAGQIDVHSEMQRVTIHIILSSLFSGEAKKDSETLVESFHTLSNFCIQRFFSPFPLPLSLAYLFKPGVRRAHEKLETVIRELIRNRRKSTERPPDLLTMLIEARDEDTGEQMTDAEVRDELMTIFFAGYDTTSFALTMTLWLLSQNTEIRESLESQADEKVSGAMTTEEETRGLTGIAQAFQEAMRLYPPVYMVNRTPIEDVNIGGYVLARSSLVLLSIWDIHRSEKYWKDPLVFDPGRFSDENLSAMRRTFLPFGGGSRACIGKNLALMEGPMILGTILKHFRLDALKNYTPKIETGATLSLANGMPMILTVR